MGVTETETEIEVEETTETVMEVKPEESMEAKITELNEKLSLSITAMKNGVKTLKEIEKLYQRALRSKKKNKNQKSGKPKEPSGFNKKTEVPLAIREKFNISKETEMARTEITRLLYSYIKEKNLQDPNDKRIIHPDKTLKALFELGDDEQLSFKNFQSHMKKLYPRASALIYSDGFHLR